MNNIRKFRGLTGITQKELAEQVGVARCFISVMESSEYPLSLKTAEKMSKVLNCSTIELLGTDNLKLQPNNDDEKILIIKMLYETLSDDGKSKLKCD